MLMGVAGGLQVLSNQEHPVLPNKAEKVALPPAYGSRRAGVSVCVFYTFMQGCPKTDEASDCYSHKSEFSLSTVPFVLWRGPIEGKRNHDQTQVLASDSLIFPENPPQFGWG